MTERRIWAIGILAILLLALFCTWHHYTPPIVAAPSLPPAAPAAVTPAAVAPAEVLPDPSLRGQFLNDRFTVSGSVPDQATKDMLLARAGTVYGKDNIVDQIQVAKTSNPDWFRSVIARFPPDLRGLAGASVATQAGTLILEGDVASEAARGQGAERLAAALGPDVKFDNRLRVKIPDTTPAAAAQPSPAALPAPGGATAAMSNGTVGFVTSSAALTPKARATLRALAKTIKGGDAGARYQVAGFTDSRGSDAFNLQLSERRAKSVQAYLIKLGVGADRLETAAKGSAEPVADNKTIAGRKENRRAEVRLL